KRGAHLALTLERLEPIVSQGAAEAARLGKAVQVSHRLQRIGLSATVRPLETTARFLGGKEFCPVAADLHLEEVGLTSTPAIGLQPRASAVAKDLAPRPVTVVYAAYKKPLYLQVITAVEDLRHLPGNSIWTAIIPEVNRLVEQHHTTLIFCNSRRLAERTADRLNEHRFLAALAGMERSPQPNPLPKGDEVSPPLLLGEAGRRAGEDSTSPR